MHLCSCFCRQFFNRGNVSLKLYEEEKDIGKTIIQAIVDCIIQNIFESLLENVGLMGVFKLVIFLLVMRIGFQVTGCLPVFILILWLLFN